MALKCTALIGTGAVGGVYAKYLYETYGDDFLILAGGERRERLTRKGITVNKTTFYPKVMDIQNPDRQVDFLIFAVKNYDLQQAIKDVGLAVKKDTLMLPLLNGITASEEIKKAYPKNRVLMGLSMGIDAIRSDSGIVNTDDGIVQFGYEDNTEPLPEVKEIDAYLKKAGINSCICPDMKRMLWRKWMLNVGVNQASAVTGARFKYFGQSSELLQLFRSAMLEVLALAEAEGVNLTMEDAVDIERVIVNFTPEGKTSMLQDTEGCRRTELDYFAGTVVSLGKKLHVPTPVNEVLYLALKAKEQVYLAESGA